MAIPVRSDAHTMVWTQTALWSVFAWALVMAGPSTSWAQSQKSDIRPQAERVLGDDLLSAFKGITHEGAYNFSRRGEPRDYYVETHYPDGRVVYQEDQDVINGAWLIQRDMLCFLYNNNELAGGCFRVYVIKNCYYYYSSALIERDDELDRDYWTARSVRKGEEPQCVAAIS